jgi:hypothetical protein
MNQHQRKFILEEIEKQYKREREALVRQKPTHPSLNNYLIAAILEGTAKVRESNKIQTEVRARVRDLGKGYTFVNSESRGGWGRSQEEAEDLVNVPALLLFETPKGYGEVKAKYEKELAAWQESMDRLEASINAMRIKVQVGSDKALSVLIDQADKLCAVSLTDASRLMLTA